MDRKSRMLSFLNQAGKGLEIGPSHNPVAPKREGFDVHVVDHCDRAALVEKYRPHGVDIDSIEDVDFVWRNTSYGELTGKPKFYDWIIASHVIEHTPDLIGFMQGADEVLKDEGVLSLAVPDKRFCFDHFRPITGIGSLIDAHVNQNHVHTAGRVAEYFLNVVSLSGRIAWDRSFQSTQPVNSFAFVHGAEDALSGMRAVTEQGAYLDVHAWCFTPSSFRLLIEDLHRLGLSPLREVAFFSDAGGEFFAALSRSGKGPDLTRMKLLENIEAEIGLAKIDGR
jgi:hypothetical protein